MLVSGEVSLAIGMIQILITVRLLHPVSALQSPSAFPYELQEKIRRRGVVNGCAV